VIETERLFWQDPYLLEFDARVLNRSECLGRPALVLDRTAFYAESGGQPWDTGRLEDVRVESVIEHGGEILHLLEAPLAADSVHGRVDGERRRDHREQHHGQHLLSQALVELCSASTVSFHLGAEACSIDLDREVTRAQLGAAGIRANEIVWEARPVVVRTVPRAEAEALGLGPKEHVGERVRLIEVPDFDVRPCGGTHPRSTAEVGVIVTLALERYKGGSRVHFVCGHRALAAVAKRNQVLDELCGSLSASLEALPAAARSAVERLAASDKRARELLDWALDGEARSLLAGASGAPAVVVHAYQGWPAQDLRTLAIRLTRAGSCVALLGSRSDKAHLVFAQSDGLTHDLGALLKDALQVVSGRGGGRGNLVQGGGERADRLDDALSGAAAAIGRR
jgi:alanyl-tRNA synthetase